MSATFPPGPRWPLPGLLKLGLHGDPIRYFANLKARYGDRVHYVVSGRHVYLFSRPEDIHAVLVTHNKDFVKNESLDRAKGLLGEGLLTSSGELHLRQRRLVQPAFHQRRMDGYGKTMGQAADRTSDSWNEAEPFDVHHAMMGLTLDIVAKTLFDTDVTGEADVIRKSLTILMEGQKLIPSPLDRLVAALPFLRPTVERDSNAQREAGTRLNETIYRMIQERRASGEDRGDLLSMLLMAQDEEGDGGTMTDTQIRDEAMTLFLAGHETTANALTWTWYLLSRHPEIEAQFHAEVDAGGSAGSPGYADLPRLLYTRKVLAESMRLYPPAWTLARRALREVPISDHVMPVNSVVFMSQYLVHRDPRYFPDPERFDPERWTPEAQDSRPRLAYFPFGAGTRQCIGESFAWMEGILLLAAIGRRWRLVLEPGQRIALLPRITLRPRYGMWMRAIRRATSNNLSA